jgi:hypothetical protein
VLLVLNTQHAERRGAAEFTKSASRHKMHHARLLVGLTDCQKLVY